jgi:hypothetical protein
VRSHFVFFGLFVAFLALSACDSTNPIAPLPEDAASDAPTFDARTSDAPTSDATLSDGPTSDSPPSDAPAPDGPISDSPPSDAPPPDAMACPSQLPSPPPPTLEQDVANLCASPPQPLDAAMQWYWAVGYSTNACGGFLVVAEHSWIDTLSYCLFDPATHEVVECGDFYNGGSILKCWWSATGYAHDLGTSCGVNDLPLAGIGWNLTIACTNDPPPPGDAGPDAATEASTDGAAD